MWGLLTSFFSSSKNVERVVDATISGVDKIWFTEEEKAEHAIKISELALKRVELALQETTVRSITRRLIALGVFGVVTVLTFWIALLWSFGKKGLAMDLLNLLKFWAVPWSAVVIFYFGYYGVKQWKGKE